jgi:hypothetical protein
MSDKHDTDSSENDGEDSSMVQMGLDIRSVTETD